MYQDLEGAISQYYDVPSISMRTAVYRLAAFKQLPGFLFENILQADHMHPTVRGHRILAELAIWLVQQTAVDLFHRPYNAADNEMASEALSAPMFPGRSSV